MNSIHGMKYNFIDHKKSGPKTSYMSLYQRTPRTVIYSSSLYSSALEILAVVQVAYVLFFNVLTIEYYHQWDHHFLIHAPQIFMLGKFEKKKNQ